MYDVLKTLKEKEEALTWGIVFFETDFRRVSRSVIWHMVHVWTFTEEKRIGKFKMETLLILYKNCVLKNEANPCPP